LRRLTVVATATTLALAGLGASSVASSPLTTLDATCPSNNNSCVWKGSLYNGNKILIGAGEGGTGWHNFDNSKFSAKNRFNNRCLELSYFIGGGGAPDTLNPGENNPAAGPGGWESYKVTGSGVLCA
jgi:hypothetical protein